ncbi:tetratricopeptide repeat protein [Oleiharenicola sp. Vm1]|uniref:tetratricopeptide repeat protein n=1 Tax=Oleiharenicola sp. Vm1 TaxID=3398393 RepID=UPI0039F46115
MTPSALLARLRDWSSRPVVGIAVIVVAVGLAWANTWNAPFVFDDTSSIVENRSIRDLASWSCLNPPHGAGETVSGRPVLNFTFALNYALGGLEVRGYHLANILIHVLAGLALFGIVRRTPVAGQRDAGFALVVALTWLLHPLQTEAVTYVVQRAESLMGLFCFLTLYGFVRATAAGDPAAPPSVAQRRAWLALSFLACLLGMGTKEVMAPVPVLVLCYDRAFWAGSFAAAWRLRRDYYLGLASTWLVLAALVATTGGDRGGTFRLAGLENWGAYWLTQFKAVVTYLGLAFWPSPQVFEYGTFWIQDGRTVLPHALLVFALGFAAMLALWRSPAWGFLGLWFFGLLAPSSVPPGTIQMLVEHRMYLPLAAVVVAVAAALRAGLRRWALPPWIGAALAAVVILSLGSASFARNRVYASEVSLWGDTVAKRPNNPRARYNLGAALAKAGRTTEAEREFQRTLALQPNHAFAHFELGKAALVSERWAEAASRFAAALQADPHYVDARVNLAQALARQGRSEEAVAQLRQALAEQPAADIRAALAGLLIQQGRPAEAAPLLQEALAQDPDLPEAHYHWARLRERAGDPVAAERELRAAVRLRPDYTAATMALGNLIARQGRFAEGIELFRLVLATEPGNHQARNNLANCFLALGRFTEAIGEYERILQAQPDNAAVRRNLEIARAMRAQR